MVLPEETFKAICANKCYSGNYEQGKVLINLWMKLDNGDIPHLVTKNINVLKSNVFYLFNFSIFIHIYKANLLMVIRRYELHLLWTTVPFHVQ